MRGYVQGVEEDDQIWIECGVGSLLDVGRDPLIERSRCEDHD